MYFVVKTKENLIQSVLVLAKAATIAWLIKARNIYLVVLIPS